jgi:hypothetical protein
VEALAHEHGDAFLAGEHVDRLDPDVVALRESARRLDVAPDRSRPRTSPASGERPGMWITTSSAKNRKARSQSPARARSM